MVQGFLFNQNNHNNIILVCVLENKTAQMSQLIWAVLYNKIRLFC